MATLCTLPHCLLSTTFTLHSLALPVTLALFLMPAPRHLAQSCAHFPPVQCLLRHPIPFLPSLSLSSLYPSLSPCLSPILPLAPELLTALCNTWLHCTISALFRTICTISALFCTICTMYSFAPSAPCTVSHLLHRVQFCTCLHVVQFFMSCHLYAVVHITARCYPDTLYR
jgi:hypothetical protein